MAPAVRVGIRPWTHPPRVHPDRYAAAEHHERVLRDLLGDIAILRRRRGDAGATSAAHCL